jgi:hypothetical protein
MEFREIHYGLMECAISLSNLSDVKKGCVLNLNTAHVPPQLFNSHIKVKLSHYRPEQAPRFQDNRHMKVVWLSAPAAFTPENIPGTHFF